MKKKYLYLLIAGLALAAALPVIILMCFCTTSEQSRPQSVMYGGVEYAYKEFLTGCVLDRLGMLDSPPTDKDIEGINAVASALDCSARYLLRAGKALDSGEPKKPRSTLCRITSPKAAKQFFFLYVVFRRAR